MRRALTVLLIVLGLPMALLAALATPSVRDLVVGRLLAAAGGSVAAAEGSLLGTLELRALRLPDAGVTIASLRLRWEPAALLRGEVLIERLALERPQLTLGDGAATDDRQPAFTGFELPVALRLEELDLRGGTLLGVAGAEALRLDVTASATARASRVSLRGVELELEEPERGVLRVLGDVEVALERALPWSTALRAALATPDSEGLELAIDAEGDLGHARAEVDLLDPWPVHATLESEDLAAGLLRARLTLREALEVGGARVLRARIDAMGDPSAAELNADLDFEVADPLGAGRMRMNGRAEATLATERVEFAMVTTAPGLELSARGATELEDFATAAALQLSVRDATRWLPDRGLVFEAGADVSVPAPLAEAPTVAIEHLALAGHLDDLELALDGATRLRLGALLGAEALDLDLRLGGNRLGIQGRATDRLDLDLTLDAPALGELAAELTGAARLSARLLGSRSSPELTVDGSAEAVGFGELRLGMLEIDGMLGIDARQPMRLRLDAEALTHPALPRPLGLHLEADGPADAIASQLRADFGEDTLELRMSLGVDAALAKVEGRLDALTLQSAALGPWALEAATGLSLDREARSVDLDGTCLTSDEARLCAEPLRARFPADAPVAVERLALRLDGLPFTRLAPVLPTSIGIAGTLSGRATVEGERQSLTLASREAELSLRDPASVEALFSDRLTLGEVTVEREGDRVSGTARLRFQTAGTAALGGALSADLANDRYEDLDLQAELAIEDLAFLGPLLPGLSAPTGNLAGRLAIRGSAEDPIIEGRLDAAAEAFVPALGRALAIRDLEVRGSARDGVRLGGALMVDEATLTFDGNADYAESRGLTASIALRGRDAQIVALPDLALWVSPDLEARLERDVLDVRGQLHLPRARIAITAVPSSGPTRSSDLVLHRPEQAAPARPLRTRAAVDLSLGEDVELVAGSLRTRLIGDLELALGLDETLTARGLIETRGGSVSRFGRELAIARGRLAFDGPITRPDVDVTATRSVGTREVGVTISGPPDALQTTLFSDPTADDATTLTMLVTGREPSEATREDADRVADAAFGLGVGVANPVLQGLGERFGIQELGYDTGTGSGSVVAGTRLSRRLYARYAYTLATRSSGLQLEYQISDRLSARTETGPVTALDLLYRREFD